MTTQDADVEEPELALPVSRRGRPVLRGSERELKAFVSSVMRGSLNDARQVTVDVLDSPTFLAPWAFEFTPASSEAVDDSYLRHVRDSDMVIWLAGVDVSPPVVNEIREALATEGCRLIVVRYAAAAPSVACQQLIEEVGLRAKYAEARDLDELRSVLQLTLSDEITRALRGLPSLGRLARIQMLGQASRARCVARWQAPGLPRGEAVALADQIAIGALSADCLPSPEAPVLVLSSQMGAGKSLGADRHFQGAIDLMLTDGGAPIPVWLTARGARGGLRAAVSAACRGIGDPTFQGATCVVDGLDEAGSEVAEQLLEEARELTMTWPRTTALFTTRPIPSLDRVEERRTVGDLDDEAVQTIAGIGAAEEILPGSFTALPADVRDSLRRPLFALLFGLRRRRDPSGAAPRSRGDLLAFLGNRVSERVDDSIHAALRRFAVRSIERELGSVPPQEIGPATDVRAMSAAGLVIERDGGVAPGLPVIAQWFAAQALLRGEIAIGDLIASPDDIDLWLYPIAIAIATGSSQEGRAILEPMMRSLPAFAFLVINEALGTVGMDEAPAPPWREAGAQMRAAVEAMADGLGDLAALALPVDKTGSMLPLGVSSRASFVDYAIWDGEDFREPLHAMPTDPGAFQRVPGYVMEGGGQVGRGSSWAWRWARDLLRRRLRNLFDHKLLPAPIDGVVAEERTWWIACALSNDRGGPDESIALAPLIDRQRFVEAEARRAGALTTWIRIGGEDVDGADLLDLLTKAQRSHPDLQPPHPSPYEISASGDYGYSESALIAYANSVYSKAIAAYEELADTSFGTLTSRLETYVTLPARYAGTVGFRRDQNGAGAASISGGLHPLPYGVPSEATFRVFEGEAFGLRPETLREVQEALSRLRPEAARWISVHATTGVFRPSTRTPSTNLAYSWLWRDLTRVRVVTGSRPGAGREF